MAGDRPADEKGNTALLRTPGVIDKTNENGPQGMRALAPATSARWSGGVAELLTDASALVAQRIDSVADLDALVPEWEQLDRSLWPRTPFTSPMWNQLWWQHLSRHGALRRDELCVYAVREAGRLIAVAPLMITSAPGWGPWRARKLHFFGADPNITEIRSMACRPEDEPRALRAVWAALDAGPCRWDRVYWSGLRQDPGTHALPHSLLTALGAEPRWLPPVEDYYVELPADWNVYRAGLSRNTKEALRKCTNSLKRAGRQVDLRVRSAPEHIDTALDRLLPLHRERAQAELPVRHVDCFRDPRARQFLRAFCRAMAARDQLRIFELCAGDTVVASRIGFLYGRELYLYYSGYDLAWGKFSVMTRLMSEILRWAIEHGHPMVNLSTGNDRSKTRWLPAFVPYYHAEGRSSGARAAR